MLLVSYFEPSGEVDPQLIVDDLNPLLDVVLLSQLNQSSEDKVLVLFITRRNPSIMFKKYVVLFL
jgi:hypothetical protein